MTEPDASQAPETKAQPDKGTPRTMRDVAESDLSQLTKIVLWCGIISWSCIPLLPAIIGVAVGVVEWGRIRRGESEARNKASLVVGLGMNVIAIASLAVLAALWLIFPPGQVWAFWKARLGL